MASIDLRLLRDVRTDLYRISLESRWPLTIWRNSIDGGSSIASCTEPLPLGLLLYDGNAGDSVPCGGGTRGRREAVVFRGRKVAGYGDRQRGKHVVLEAAVWGNGMRIGLGMGIERGMEIGSGEARINQSIEKTTVMQRDKLQKKTSTPYCTAYSVE